MINHRYQLPDHLIRKASLMEEYANGATQITVRLRDGREFQKILLSDATYVIAAGGFKDLPFSISDIEDIFQLPDDKNPAQRGGWYYWDNWK